MHFSIVAELDGRTSPEALGTALGPVQRRHPLLRVRVGEREPGGLVFERAEDPPELTVVEEPMTWQEVVSAELARPFNAASAPLWRTVLVQGRDHSTVVLTFEHSIADGVSAIGVLSDVLAAVDGATLEGRPVPPAQEDLVEALVAPVEELGGPPADASGVDERMTVVGSCRPFDSTRPHVSAVALDAAATRQLLARCRAERTTVHAAVCAAVTQVAGHLRGQEFVRVFSPISLRHLVDLAGDVALRTVVGRTGFPADPTEDLWELARDTARALAPSRSLAGVSAASAATTAMVPPGATAATAEAFMLGGASFEVEVTNLGVVDLQHSGRLRPVAVWGPLVLDQVSGEQVIGVSTFAGQLRLTCASYELVPDLLDEVRRTLVMAAGAPVAAESLCGRSA